MTAFSMDLAESIGVADAVPVQDVTAVFGETVGVAEVIDVQPLVALAESLGVVDSNIVQEIILGLTESIDVVEFMPFNSEMVISNMKMTDMFTDLFEFTEIAKADRVLGFDPFSRLVPGDKEYQNAILRLVVRAPTNLGDDRIGIGKTVLNVDIADVDDRDDAVALAASVTTINYAKVFQLQVSLNITIVGAAQPVFFELTNQTLTSFDIVLRDIASPFNPVTGTINWSAKGF